MVWLNPFIRTPINDMLGNVSTWQFTPCMDFEMNFFKCMEAYGYQLGMKYCDLERRDYFECQNNEKQMKRFEKIREQRKKLFLQGKLDRPFINGPPLDYAQEDYFHQGMP